MAENEGTAPASLQGVIVKRVVTLDEMVASLTKRVVGKPDAQPRVTMFIRSNMGWTEHKVELVVNGLECSSGFADQYGWKGRVVSVDGVALQQWQHAEGTINLCNPLQVSDFMGFFHYTNR